MRAPIWQALVVATVAPLLAGCGFLTMIGIPVKDDAPKKPEDAATPTQGAPVAPAPAEPASPDIYGTWTGTTEFTSYTMLLPEGEGRATFESGVAGTIGQVYSLQIDVYSKGEARLVFDDKTTVSGSFTQDGDAVTFVFRRAGDDEFEVGASPPVSFTFTGALESTPTRAMAGTVLYEVFTKDGSQAWTETGEWIVTP